MFELRGHVESQDGIRGDQTTIVQPLHDTVTIYESIAKYDACILDTLQCNPVSLFPLCNLGLSSEYAEVNDSLMMTVIGQSNSSPEQPSVVYSSVIPRSERNITSQESTTTITTELTESTEDKVRWRLFSVNYSLH